MICGTRSYGSARIGRSQRTFSRTNTSAPYDIITSSAFHQWSFPFHLLPKRCSGYLSDFEYVRRPANDRWQYRIMEEHPSAVPNPDWSSGAHTLRTHGDITSSIMCSSVTHPNRRLRQPRSPYYTPSLRNTCLLLGVQRIHNATPKPMNERGTLLTSSQGSVRVSFSR